MERSRPVKLCIYDNIEVVVSITIKTIFLKHPQSFSIFLHYGILSNFISYHKYTLLRVGHNLCTPDLQRKHYFIQIEKA